MMGGAAARYTNPSCLGSLDSLEPCGCRNASEVDPCTGQLCQAAVTVDGHAFSQCGAGRKAQARGPQAFIAQSLADGPIDTGHHDEHVEGVGITENISGQTGVADREVATVDGAASRIPKVAIR